MRNRLNDKNFGILMREIIVFTRLVFEIFLTLKYVTVFAGPFLEKSETFNQKGVYTMLSRKKMYHINNSYSVPLQK